MTQLESENEGLKADLASPHPDLERARGDVNRLEADLEEKRRQLKSIAADREKEKREEERRVELKEVRDVTDTSYFFTARC